MSVERLMQIRGWLAYVLVAFFLIAGTAGLFIDFDETSHEVLWFTLLFGGAALVIAGLLLVQRTSGGSGALMCLGGVAGGLPLLGTILVPVAVAALIALSVAIARQAPRAA
jgi:hypothetical protein